MVVKNRWIDGVIVLGERHVIHDKKIFKVEGKDILCIQTKSGKIGMNLLGQAIGSKRLLEIYYNLRSVRSIALCTRGDSVILAIAEEFGIEVVIM